MRVHRTFLFVLGLALTIGGSGLPGQAETTPETPEAAAPAVEGREPIKIELVPPPVQAQAAVSRFSARITVEELSHLLTDRTALLPMPLNVPELQGPYLQAIRRVEMGALAERLQPILQQAYPNSFDASVDMILRPLPEDQQIDIAIPDHPDEIYVGPEYEVLGFLVHNITKEEFIQIAIRAIVTARQLLDLGDPLLDRGAANHLESLARREAEQLMQAHQRRRSEAESRAVAQEEARRERAEARRQVASALGIYDPQADDIIPDARPEWAKESRRFTYILRTDEEGRVIVSSEEFDGIFIERLQPLVDHINRKMAMAGLHPPGVLDRPGIYFDPELGDVEIVLPRPMLEDFLREADQIEQRMAHDDMISVEAVRLTDRDIVTGALASRLNVLSQGVHDVQRDAALRREVNQFGINSLLAVANRELAVSNLRGIEDGRLPAGAPPVQFPSLSLPPAPPGRTATTVGGDFSVGADDIFFDGRQQTYGFSYVTPDGIEHILSLEVVDSLREFWDRIERNLIVHKIRKTPELTDFTVPVGPQTQTFKGIAALITQEDQDIVITNQQGALVRLSAKAGSWLVIRDFEIAPTPGSSTSLTEDEARLIEARVLLTMLLRDPRVDFETKMRLIDAPDLASFESVALPLLDERAHEPVLEGPMTVTYDQVYSRRRTDTIHDATVEKKERNSVIKLNFYSSQGNIIRPPGTTELGSANDLTSFTTELRPNVVTPISSSFTKSAGGATGSSPLTGIRKGEQTNEEKTMTHLVVRVRFPTIEREKMDRDEGRYLGYYVLPLGRKPHSTVDLPFLSSSDHPLDRLARLQSGLMFETLQRERVKRPLELINPNSLMGTISLSMWETATTRLLLNRRIIANSPNVQAISSARYRDRFNIEVRSLLEYDDVFFDRPSIALRNMAHWNDPERILDALNNSPGQFAMRRLVAMIEELGALLIPDDFAEIHLGISPPAMLGHQVRSLTHEELETLRRDVANHYLRFNEVYGDAFLEAVSHIFSLGTYRAQNAAQLRDGPFRGYHEIVLLDGAAASVSQPDRYQRTVDLLALLKEGGYRGRLFEPSMQTLGDLPSDIRSLIFRGRDILKNPGLWAFFWE